MLMMTILLAGQTVTVQHACGIRDSWPALSVVVTRRMQVILADDNKPMANAKPIVNNVTMADTSINVNNAVLLNAIVRGKRRPMMAIIILMCRIDDDKPFVPNRPSIIRRGAKQ